MTLFGVKMSLTSFILAACKIVKLKYDNLVAAVV